MAGLLPAGEAALIQAVVTASMDGTCTLSIYSKVADGHGGFTETWTPNATTTPMMVAQSRDVEMQSSSDRLSGRGIEYIVHVPTGINLKIRDRLLNCYDGHSYEVVALDDTAAYSMSTRYGVRRTA